MNSNAVKTNFDKVLEFNKAFGVITNTEQQRDIFDTNTKLVEYRLSLIDEEVKELHQAIEEKNYTEVVDAISDILYVVYGAATAFGFDADKMFDIVHKSNMSKLCISEEDAQKTVESYKEEVPRRYDSPEYRLSDDKTHFIVFNKSTMKILKNIKYTPAKFDE